MLRRAVLGSVAGFALAVAAPAAAARPRPIDIEAQSLAGALHALSRAADVDLVFDPAAVKGLQAPAVRGTMSVEAALQRLLAGRGLAARRVRSGAWVIERVAPPRPPTTLAADREAPPEPVVPEILVVGRRSQNADIARRESDVQPYRVSTREDVLRAHRDDLDQYFRSRITANTQVVPPSLTDQGATYSEIDLRGLGADGTLVLLDGRRLPGIPTNSTALGLRQPDLNAVPLHAIERVETLTGTAGGIYGFGALGGVTNVVLRRDYRGFDVHATGGISARGDSPRYALEGRLGFTPDGGRTDVMLYASRSRSEPLLVGERSYALREARQSLRFAPDRLSEETPTRNSIAIFSFTRAPLTFAPGLGGAALGSDRTYLPIGFAGTRADLVATLQAKAGQGDVVPDDGTLRSDMGSTPVTTAAFLNVRHRFGDALELFADAVFLRNRGRHVDFRDEADLYLFPGAPENPFAQFVEIVIPVPGRRVEKRTTVTTRRYTVGAIVALPSEWRASAEATWGRASFAQHNADRNYWNGPIFLFGSTAGPPLDPLGPWEAFKAAASDPAYRRSSFFEARRTNRYEEQALRFAGPLFQAAGGPVTLTLLAERRKQEVPDSTATLSSPPTLFEYVSVGPSGRTTSFYGELRAPLGGEESKLPFLRGLELQLALRRDRLDAKFVNEGIGRASGETLRPRFEGTAFTAGGKARPWPWLMIRASYATGRQPPRLENLISVESTGFSAYISDPKRGNSLFTGEGQYRLTSEGFPDLAPVRATTLSLGGAITPFGSRGPQLILDYSRIRRLGDFLRLNESFVLQHEDEWPERVVRGPLSAQDRAKGYTGGPLEAIDARGINGTDRRVEALDGRLEWPMRLLGGRLRASASATLQLRQVEKTRFQPARDIVGYSDTPVKLRANGGLEWARGGTALGANLQYFSRYRIESSAGPSALVVHYQGSPHVPAQTYLDLFASRRFDLGRNPAGGARSLVLDFGIVNALDAAPPRQTAQGFGGPPYSLYGDPRRRRFELVVSYEF